MSGSPILMQLPDLSAHSPAGEPAPEPLPSFMVAAKPWKRPLPAMLVNWKAEITTKRAVIAISAAVLLTYFGFRGKDASTPSATDAPAWESSPRHHQVSAAAVPSQSAKHVQSHTAVSEWTDSTQVATVPGLPEYQQGPTMGQSPDMEEDRQPWPAVPDHSPSANGPSLEMPANHDYRPPAPAQNNEYPRLPMMDGSIAQSPQMPYDSIPVMPANHPGAIDYRDRAAQSFRAPADEYRVAERDVYPMMPDARPAIQPGRNIEQSPRPGVARFEGIIEKPPVEPNYELHRSSVY